MWIKSAFRRSRGAQVGEESGRGKEGLKKWESTESRNQIVSCRLLHATHSSDIVTFVMIKFKYGFPADLYTEIIWIQLTYYISMYILSKLKTFRRVALWENKTISRPDQLHPVQHLRGHRVPSLYGGTQRTPVVMAIFWQGPDYISTSNFTRLFKYIRSLVIPKSL